MNDAETQTSSDATGLSFTVGGIQTSIGVDPACGPDVAYIFTNDPNTGMYTSGAAIVNFVASSTVDDVYDLFFAGKTIKDHGDEYLDVINRLPVVDNQLEAIEILEFFRRQMFPESDEK